MLGVKKVKYKEEYKFGEFAMINVKNLIPINMFCPVKDGWYMR